MELKRIKSVAQESVSKAEIHRWATGMNEVPGGMTRRFVRTLPNIACSRDTLTHHTHAESQSTRTLRMITFKQNIALRPHVPDDDCTSQRPGCVTVSLVSHTHKVLLLLPQYIP